MRSIVACPKCRRQYDAAGRKPGSRFRCLCGRVMTVRQPQGHDARVVRCSSCGAPREEGSDRCKFCGADFTVHELDLNTVCPKCLARVSDRAKFCHYCGVRIMPEMAAGDATALRCPTCGDGHVLTSRQIGEVAVMECSRCVGLWLGQQTFDRLSEQAAQQVLNIDEVFQPLEHPPGATGSAPGPTDSSPASPSPDSSQGTVYRQCPLCHAMMYRRNFGRRSGVIVDVCREHGVWFDADELPRILRWIRAGGLARANEDRARKAARDERDRRTEEAFSRTTRPTWTADEGEGAEFGVILGALSQLFGI